MNTAATREEGVARRREGMKRWSWTETEEGGNVCLCVCMYVSMRLCVCRQLVKSREERKERSQH